jgi:putative membrane protein
MLVRWFLAAIHLLAFGFALASILRRSRGLRRCTSTEGLPAIFSADNGWGGSAVVLIVTGAMRAFGGFEKGADYYLHEPLFHVKMGALVLILLLEIAPMMALLRWRNAVKNGDVPDLTRAPKYARIGMWQTLLLVVMVFAATGMARGIGLAGMDADGAS